MSYRDYSECMTSNQDERAMTFPATTRRKGCSVTYLASPRVPQANSAKGRFSTTPKHLVEFSLDVETSTSKMCSVCQMRPGWYVVVYWAKEDRTWGNKVRYCWNCLPAEQRHYLRVNY